MPIGGERAAVQNPVLRYAEEVGWSFLLPARVMELGEGSEVCHVL